MPIPPKQLSGWCAGGYIGQLVVRSASLATIGTSVVYYFHLSILAKMNGPVHIAPARVY
jgi:hypothetical protein